MSQFYSLTPPQVMALPIKTFWWMHNCIDRIKAQDDMRHLTVAASAQSSEAAMAHRERLEAERGDIVVVDETEVRSSESLDIAGLDELRNLE